MAILNASNNTEFNSISELKSITIQPQENDNFNVVENGIRCIYNYEFSNTLTSDDDFVVALNNFSGRFLKIGDEKLTQSTIANFTNAGRFRYYTSGGFSYLECCMQTGTTTYEWILISQQQIL